MPGALAQVNLSALTAALAEIINAYEVSERPGLASGGREQVFELERRLRPRFGSYGAGRRLRFG